MASEDGAVKFALKDSIKDLDGLTTSVGGEFVDVKARLGSNGEIVTSDPVEIAAFQGIDELKQVTGQKPATVPGAAAGKEKS